MAASGGLAAIVDRSVALELSAAAADGDRLGFARSFPARVFSAYRSADGAVGPTAANSTPTELDEVALPPYAESVAVEIGANMRSMSPIEAAYAIGAFYSALLPEQYRSQHGIFYTPPDLVERLLVMTEEAGVDWRTTRVLDPACGGGAFLIAVAQRMMGALEGTAPEIALESITARLRGFDIDPFGAWLARAMLGVTLAPLACNRGRAGTGIVDLRDSLDPRYDEVGRYDLIVGNPPYGRVTLPATRRRWFARSVYGHANLYGIFTDSAMHWTRPGGIIGFVTPTSMLSGLYFKSLRRVLAREAPPVSINFVTERDGVFAGVLQETMLAIYRKGGPQVPGRVGFLNIKNGCEILTRNAGGFTLPTSADAPWLLPRSAEQAGLARRLRSMPHRLVSYGYSVSTGPLVWNRHKGQLGHDASDQALPIVWAESVTSDGRFVWRSEKRNHAPWFRARRPRDDWLIVTQPCVLLQRTTAKEQSRRLIAAELPEKFIRCHGGVTVENHLNMVRARQPNPSLSSAVIATLLNSAAVDAAFRCINGSVAVSAFELEELPLPAPNIVGRVARLLAAAAPSGKIEATIAAAYGIDNVAAPT